MQYINHIDYNVMGQKTLIEYGNGTVTVNTYDALNFRLTRVYTTNSQGTTLQDLSYTYDALGQIKAITDAVNTATQAFNYDAQNRLTQAQGGY